MSEFFSTVLTENEQMRYASVFDYRTISVNGCIIWTGQQKRGYGIHEFRFRGKKIKIAAHRLKYFLVNDCKVLHKHDNISHLCHNKLCVKIDHLSKEPQNINNQRQICKNNGNCNLHYGFPKCLL